MKKYEIFTDRFEFRAGAKARLYAVTADEVFDDYLATCDTCPKLESSFDNLSDAISEFNKNYRNWGRTWAEKGFVNWLLVGEVAYIQEMEYDENGDFDQGGDVIDFSAADYTPPEEKPLNDPRYFDAAVALMDDDIREDIHASGEYDTPEKFLAEYERRHKEKFGVDFIVN